MNDNISIELAENAGVIYLDWESLKWKIAEGGRTRSTVGAVHLADSICDTMTFSPKYGRLGVAQAIRISKQLKGSMVHIPPAEPRKAGVIY